MLFDLDGTCVKSEILWIAVMLKMTNEMRKKQGLGPLDSFTREDEPNISGRTIPEHLTYCRDKYFSKGNRQKDMEEAREIYDRITKSELEMSELIYLLENRGQRPFAPALGLKELLLELKARDVKIAMVTSGLYYKAWPELKSAFDQMELGDPLKFLDAFISAGQKVTKGQAGTIGDSIAKPWPNIYLEAALTLGWTPESSGTFLIVGDSASDVGSAVTAGIPVVGLTGGNIQQAGVSQLCLSMFENLVGLTDFIKPYLPYHLRSAGPEVEQNSQAKFSRNSSAGVSAKEEDAIKAILDDISGININSESVADLINKHRDLCPIFTRGLLARALERSNLNDGQKLLFSQLVVAAIKGIVKSRKVIRLIPAAGKGVRRFPFTTYGSFGRSKPLTEVDVGVTLLENTIKLASLVPEDASDKPQVFINTWQGIINRADFQAIIEKHGIQSISMPEGLSFLDEFLIALFWTRHKFGEDAVVTLLPSDQNADASSMKACLAKAEAVAFLEPTIARIGAEIEANVSSVGMSAIKGLQDSASFFSGVYFDAEKISRRKTLQNFTSISKERGWFWNTGIRVFKIKTFLDIYKENYPERYKMFNLLENNPSDENIQKVAKLVRGLEEIPIGRLTYYARENPAFSPSIIGGLTGWADYGSIASDSTRDTVFEGDIRLRGGKGANIIVKESRNCSIVLAPGDNSSRIELVGVEGLVVAYNTRNNTVVILPKSSEMAMSYLTDALVANDELRKYIYMDSAVMPPTQRTVCNHKSPKPNNSIYQYKNGDGTCLGSDNTALYSNNGLVCLFNLSNIVVVRNADTISIYGSQFLDEAREEIYRLLKEIPVEYEPRTSIQLREKVPDIMPGLQNIIEKYYGLKVTDISPLSEKTARYSFTVTTDNEKFVFRALGSDREKALSTIGIIRLVNDMMPKAVKLQGTDGSEDQDYLLEKNGFYFMLEYFVEGVVVDSTKISDRYFYELGKAMGNFHNKTTVCPPRLTDNLPPASTAPDMRDATAYALDFRLLKTRLDLKMRNAQPLTGIETIFYHNYEFLMSQIEILIKNDYKRMYVAFPRNQLIHRDLSTPNILFSGLDNPVRAFVDPETLTLAPRIMEFPNALLGRGALGTPLKYYGKESLEELIRGYESVVEKNLSKEESEMLILLLKARFILMFIVKFLLESVDYDITNSYLEDMMSSFRIYCCDFTEHVAEKKNMPHSKYLFKDAVVLARIASAA